MDNYHTQEIQEQYEKSKLENPMERKQINSVVMDYSDAMKNNTNTLENNLSYLRILLYTRLKINEYFVSSLIKISNYTTYQMNM